MYGSCHDDISRATLARGNMDLFEASRARRHSKTGKYRNEMASGSLRDEIEKSVLCWDE